MKTIELDFDDYFDMLIQDYQDGEYTGCFYFGRDEENKFLLTELMPDILKVLKGRIYFELDELVKISDRKLDDDEVFKLVEIICDSLNKYAKSEFATTLWSFEKVFEQIPVNKRLNVILDALRKFYNEAKIKSLVDNFISSSNEHLLIYIYESRKKRNTGSKHNKVVEEFYNEILKLNPGYKNKKEEFKKTVKRLIKSGYNIDPLLNIKRKNTKKSLKQLIKDKIEELTNDNYKYKKKGYIEGIIKDVELEATARIINEDKRESFNKWIKNNSKPESDFYSRFEVLSDIDAEIEKESRERFLRKFN